MRKSPAAEKGSMGATAGKKGAVKRAKAAAMSTLTGVGSARAEKTGAA